MNNLSNYPGGLLAIYALLVGLSSLMGGWILLAMRLNHARLQVTVSVVAGLMLGMAMLHFIPHAAHESGSLGRAMQWTLAGFLSMFFLQRFLPYHHHEVPGHAAHHPEHGETTSEAPDDLPATLAEGEGPGSLSWVGTTMGMSLHSLTGGFAVAAAVMEESGQHGGLLLGLGTALVVILHKPFDAGAVSTVMAASGCSRSARHLANGLFATVTPLGMLLFYLSASHVAHMDPEFIGAALAFCAGTFLCISCADLLPELQFHSHDRLKLSLALAAGLGIAILIGMAEGASEHEEHGATSGATPQEVRLVFSEPRAIHLP